MKRTKKAACLLALAVLLVQGASAFIGEEGFISELLDLMSRKTFARIVEEIASPLKVLYYERFTELVRTNPDPLDAGMAGVMGYLTRIVGALYVVALISLGVYIIFFSGSPRGRGAAKSMFLASILGMVLVIVCPYLIGFVLSFSHDRTADVLNLWPGGNPMTAMSIGDGRINAVDYFMSRFADFSWSSLAGSLPFMLILLLLMAGALAVMVFRYLAVAFFTLMLPLTIFLYSFLPTRGVGRRMLEQTLLWTFSQVAEAITLVSVAWVAYFVPVSELRLITVIAGAAMLAFVPMATVGFFRDFIP